MSIAALIRRMADAGASAEAIAIAVEAIEAPRAKARERKARQRERERDSHACVTGQSRDISGQERDGSLPLPPSPQTPQPPTPSLPDITTRAREADAEGFDGFWSAYPRKVGKPKALLAYRSALRRAAGPDPPTTILNGLTTHLPAWAHTEPDLVPHPTTWLNRDGWEDQPPSSKPRIVHGPARQSPGVEKLVAVGGAMRAAFRDG